MTAGAQQIVVTGSRRVATLGRFALSRRLAAKEGKAVLAATSLIGTKRSAASRGLRAVGGDVLEAPARQRSAGGSALRWMSFRYWRSRPRTKAL